MTTTLTPPIALPVPTSGTATPQSLVPALRKFTVPEYQRLIDAGILQSGEKVELLDGYLVQKMTIHPPHTFSLQATWQLILPLLGGIWEARVQQPILLATSMPEPDLALARGTRHTYATCTPVPADLGLVVEVADTSLAIDRGIKGPLYGAAGIAVYWIVDVIHRQVELYTLAGGGYGPPLVLTPGQLLPLVLAGVHLGDLPVVDLFV
jgi:Uma2 family endonuclease